MEYVKQKRKKREISAASQASLAEKKIIRSITYIYISIHGANMNCASRTIPAATIFYFILFFQFLYILSSNRIRYPESSRGVPIVVLS